IGEGDLRVVAPAHLVVYLGARLPVLHHAKIVALRAWSPRFSVPLRRIVGPVRVHEVQEDERGTKRVVREPVERDGNAVGRVTVIAAQSEVALAHTVVPA